MTVVEALRTRLLGLAPVTALVSTRIYPVAFPQSGAWPAVRLQLIGNVEFMHMRGSSRVNRARVQVDVVVDIEESDDWYADAHALMAAIHGDGQFEDATGLNGWRGDIGGSPPEFEITGILPDAAGPRDFPGEADEERQFRVQRDYLTWFIE